jgi:predicted CXXCH cytochrome family protein
VTKLISALFAAAVLVTAASAATPPEKITFDAKAGKVTFPHKAHAGKGCKTCHEAAPGKIAGFNKDKAHALCKACHEKEGKGPTKCDGCHKK